jgi:hypothetical protein
MIIGRRASGVVKLDRDTGRAVNVTCPLGH